MASKTRRMVNKPTLDADTGIKDKMQSNHLSALMMLSSQLMSNGRFNDGLPSFVTRGLDAEQIWQQLELRNEHKLSISACTKEVARMQSSQSRRMKKEKKKRKGKTETVTDRKNLENSESLEGSDSDSDEEDVLESIKRRLAQKPGSSKNTSNNIASGESDEDEIDFDFEMDKEISRGLSDDDEDEDGILTSNDKPKKRQAPKRASVVDDKFFKLADMEEFLDSEDLKEEKKRKREDKGVVADDESEEDEDEEDVDMFGEFEEEDDDDDGAKGAKYSDFFDPPDDKIDSKQDKKKKQPSEDIENDEGSEDEDQISDMDDNEEDGMEEMDDQEADSDDNDNTGFAEEEAGDSSDPEGRDNVEMKEKSTKKAVSFTEDLLQGSDDEAEGENDDEGGAKEAIKSTFEKKQEQLQAQAREMEEQSLREAPWELTGEATAAKRPENSLLETHLDFQHTTRAAPVITEETTKTLEGYIKQRIKDKAFDDVERKEKPKEDPFEFKKRIVLDQEKSKMSLGELYEQEFMKQQQQDKDEVKADPECEKIEGDLKKIFQQLDALCNFRYTPFQAGTEVKILVNTPAISMEEVAPTAASDAQLLAPEEVREKIRGDYKANEERDSTDKKRDRRHKKKEKREKKKAKEAREKLVEKMKPGLGNKYSKAKAIKQLEQLSKTDKNVTLIQGNEKKMASSTAFFNQLQEEVQTNVRAKKAIKEKKKKQAADASKIML